MNLFDLIRRPLLEGGNIAIGGEQAQHINLEVTNRSIIVPILDKLLKDINAAYQAQFKTPLWSPKLLKSQSFLSGSSLHFFNVKGIPDKVFIEKKPKVGDIDTMVNKEYEANLEQFLQSIQGQSVGGARFIGFQRGNEQFSSLWELQDPPIKIQIDLEFVDYDKDQPTDWSRFSHSSSWDDLDQGIKGVFHKFLIQSFGVLTKRQFILRKQEGRGKARTWVDVPEEDSMLSFAVSSKEGGGLRAKYTPVTNPETGEPEMKDGLPVMMALPAAGYEKDIGKIFRSLFGVRLDDKQAKKLQEKFWSFTGLLEVMNQILDSEEKQRVVGSFLQKCFGKGSQGLYRNDPDRDIAEKSAAVDVMLSMLRVQPPEGMNLEQMKADYKASYRMTKEEVDEADDPTTPAKPNYARQGIQHLYNRLPDGRVSSVEMRDADFVELCREIAQNGGTLDGIQVNLKVDGAGIRFGKDESGRTFFMTSKVTQPLYADNVGFFTDFGRNKGQDEEQLARTKKYDDALSLIVNSKFIQRLPDDTIVQAEMLYNPMAQQADGGLKFVNIPYDPKKLGKEMTLVPFMVKQYSTGESSPNEDKIIQALTAASDGNIKIITNKLEQKGINVSKTIDPVVNMDPALEAALKTRGTNPEKEQAKSILDQARQALSRAIIDSPKLKGKDILGANNEGVVVNMPSGRLFKVTSQQMKAAMAAKPAAMSFGDKKTRTAVVAIGNFAGHKGHEQLINYAVAKAQELHGTPFVFVGHKVGPEDPIDINTKIETLKKLYPEVHISVVQNQIGADGQETQGSIFKKIEYELIKKEPFYNNVVITVGSDQAGLQKTVDQMQGRYSKFPPLAHVKVSLYVTPRKSDEGGTGVSTTQLRNALKTMPEEQAFQIWSQAYNVNKLGANWIRHLMNVARKHMGINKPTPAKVQERLFNALVRPKITEANINQKVASLAAANNIADPNKIHVGQKITLPNGTTYTVAPGDTLSGIAAGQFKTQQAKVPQPQPSVRTGPNPNISQDTRQRATDYVKAKPPKQPVVQKPNALQEPGFLEKAKMVAANIGVNIQALLGVMKHESNLNPAAVNPQSGATGLIQFMPKTAQGLGTSTADLKAMAATDQLDYVEKYFKPIAGKAKDIGDLYMYTFMPAAVGKPDNFVIGVQNGSEKLWGLNQGQLYAQNAVFDKDKKGYYTVGDIKSRISGFAESVELSESEKQYHGWEEYEEDKSSQVAEFLHELQPNLFSRYGDEFVINVIEKVCRTNPQASVTQSAGEVIRHLKSSVDEARMSAAVKLQRAWDREQSKSAFAGSNKNKLGPAAHLKGSMRRPAKAGDLVGGGAEESIQHKQVSISEDAENLINSLINKIVANETVQNNKRRYI